MALTRAFSLSKGSTFAPATPVAGAAQGGGQSNTLAALAAAAPSITPGASGPSSVPVVAPSNTWPGLRGMQKPDGVPVSYWNEFVASETASWMNQTEAQQKDVERQSAYLEAHPELPRLSKHVAPSGDWTGDILTEFAALPAGKRASYASMDKAAGVSDQIVNTASQTAQQNAGYFDATVNPALAAQEKAIAGAGAASAEGLKTLRNSALNTKATLAGITDKFKSTAAGANSDATATQGTLAGTYSQLAAADQAGLGKYQSETNPLMTQLQGQGYGADVTASPEDLAAQRTALQKFGDQSDPNVTAVERANAEAARQKFEAGDQSNRQAQMRDLALRGLNSGGAQIAQQQAAHQQLANDRMNAELGLQASAQGRASAALQGYASQANTLRAGDDALSQFNKTQKLATQAKQDAEAQAEANRVAGLAGSRLGATQTTNAGIGTRASDQSQQGQAVTAANTTRTNAALAAAGQNAQSGYAMDQDTTKAANDAAQQTVTNTTGQIGSAQGAATARAAVTDPQKYIDALKYAAGTQDVEEAKKNT